MRVFQVVSGSNIQVHAKSAVHDTRTVWNHIDGDIRANVTPSSLTDISMRISVTMGSFNAGSFLKNQALKKQYPTLKNSVANFVLEKFETRHWNGTKGKGVVYGELVLHGYPVAVTAEVEATVRDTEILANATFALDLQSLGLRAPKLLMFQVDNVVAVTVELRGQVQPRAQKK